MLRTLFCLLAFVLLSADGLAEELNEKTFAVLRDRIRPKTAEVCYQTVDWLPTFWDGVIVAQKEDKPILLWAMNGHPLACT